jgi:hypothetical protein
MNFTLLSLVFLQLDVFFQCRILKPFFLKLPTLFHVFEMFPTKFEFREEYLVFAHGTNVTHGLVYIAINCVRLDNSRKCFLHVQVTVQLLSTGKIC